MTRSYIKLYGAPIYEGLKALEKIAVEMNQDETVTMRFYHTALPPTIADLATYQLEELERFDIPVEEKVKLFSQSVTALGDYDFFFEWGADPTIEQVMTLIAKIDGALTDCGCMYTITTK